MPIAQNLMKLEDVLIQKPRKQYLMAGSHEMRTRHLDVTDLMLDSLTWLSWPGGHLDTNYNYEQLDARDVLAPDPKIAFRTCFFVFLYNSVIFVISKSAKYFNAHFSYW